MKTGLRAKQRRRQASHRAATRLGIESLEPRAMLAADMGWAFELGGPVILADSEVNIGPDQQVYVTGSFSGAVDFDPGPGVVQRTATINATDGFVAKYTPDGELIWANQFGGNDGHEFSNGVEFDAAGNAYIVGHTNATSATFDSFSLANQGSYDVFVAKLDAATGNFDWVRSLGGTDQDTAYDLQVTASGEVYAIGTFRDTVDFDPSPTSTFNLTDAGGTNAGDAFVWKLDTNGNFQWARQLGGSELENGHRVALGNDGFVYTVGTFRGTVDFGQSGNPLVLTSPTLDAADLFIVKLAESTGDSVWARQATGTEHINAARLAADGAGSLYFAGGFKSTVNFGSGTPTLVSAGDSDAFISKWDTDGNFVWAESVSGADAVKIKSLQLDDSGIPLITFGFEGTADFDPGASVAELTSTDQIDGAIVQLNADGSFNWVRQASGPGTTEAHGIVKDSAGNVYATGFFQNSAVLPSGDELAQSGNGTFVMKLTDPSLVEVVFADSFENGQWNGNWVEDSQNDWFTSTQRATEGNFSAEVDGLASNATLTLATPIDLSGFATAELTFDWLIENGFDSGEYLALDISTNGGASWQNDVRRLNGNSDPENTWHSETVDLTAYLSSSTLIRFRSSVSRSNEDANVDNVRIVASGTVGPPDELPTANAGGPYAMDEGGSVTLDASGSFDTDGTIASYAWDLDNDGQYDDASGVTASFRNSNKTLPVDSSRRAGNRW